MIIKILGIIAVMLTVGSCGLSYDESKNLFPPDILCSSLSNCIDSHGFATCNDGAQKCYVDQLFHAYDNCSYNLNASEKESIQSSFNDFITACEAKTSNIQGFYNKIEWCLTKSNDQELLIFICKIK